MRLLRRSFSTNAGTTHRRSYLYVPSTSDRMLDKSLVTNSDTIIYDLEDSVPPSPTDKSNARIRLCNFLLVCMRNPLSHGRVTNHNSASSIPEHREERYPHQRRYNAIFSRRYPADSAYIKGFEGVWSHVFRFRRHPFVQS